MSAEKYLSYSQLSEKLGGRSRASLYRDVDAGRLPQPLKMGARSLFRESAVDELLLQQEREQSAA